MKGLKLSLTNSEPCHHLITKHTEIVNNKIIQNVSQQLSFDLEGNATLAGMAREQSSVNVQGVNKHY